MDPQNTTPQSQIPVSSPAKQPVAPHGALLKNQRLLWILTGIFVLLVGIGIGMFIMHPTQ